MILFPNAKINLGLDILSRRADGYHEIETILYPIPWHDILEIVPAGDERTTLTVTGRPVDCPPEKNLVMKAFRALEQAVGHDLEPVDIYLHKIVPDGAGLGGGSSDAAFTLKGVNQLLALGLNDDELAAVAATVGADCPFFIYNRPMLATGIGTTLAPIDLNLRDMTIVLVKPPESVPTALAYRDITPGRPDLPLARRVTASPGKWNNLLPNAFEATVIPKIPTITSIKQALGDAGAIYAAMSGSGSAVFGIFDTDILAEKIEQMFPEMSTFVGTLA